MNKNFKNMSIGAIASAIAGAYYMYGSPDGVAKRKQLAAWSVKMKGEVLEGIEKLKTVSEPAYKDLVKKVSAKYAKVDKGELKKVVDEMHSTWNKMKSTVKAEIAKKDEMMKKEVEKMAKMKNAAKAGASKAKATVKTAAKKTVTKAVSAVKKAAPKKSTPAVKSVEVKMAPEKEMGVKIENTENK